MRVRKAARCKNNQAKVQALGSQMQCVPKSVIWKKSPLTSRLQKIGPFFWRNRTSYSFLPSLGFLVFTLHFDFSKHLLPARGPRTDGLQLLVWVCHWLKTTRLDENTSKKQRKLYIIKNHQNPSRMINPTVNGNNEHILLKQIETN